MILCGGSDSGESNLRNWILNICAEREVKYFSEIYLPLREHKWLFGSGGYNRALIVPLGCNNGGGRGIFSKVKRLVRMCMGTRKQLFSGFSLTDIGFEKRRNFVQELILLIKPFVCIGPSSRAVRISKKIWIQTYFESATFDSEQIFCHFALWRHGTRLATFLSFLLHLRTAFFEAHFLCPLKIWQLWFPKSY